MGPAQMGIQRDGIVVVVAVDQGAASVGAFHKAVRVFRRHPGAIFHLVHVRQPGSDLHKAEKLSAFGLAELWSRVEREEAAEASRQVLRAFSQRAADEGIQFEAAEAQGSPTQALKEYCQAVGADLLVVGSLRRFWMPTVNRPVFLWCHGKKPLSHFHVPA